MKKRLLFVITQFYKGGAETSLLNLFKLLDPEQYEIDFVILNQEVYADATSLVGQVPRWIQVYDVFGQRVKRGIIDQYIGRIYRRLFHTETYRKAAVKFLLENGCHRSLLLRKLTQIKNMCGYTLILIKRILLIEKRLPNMMII